MPFPPVHEVNVVGKGTWTGEVVLRVRPEAIPCKPCRREFYVLSELHDHWDEEEVHHYCRKCNSHFETQDELYDHLGDTELHHVCDLCTHINDFDTLGSLRRHWRADHSDEYCSLCKAHFENDTSALRVHMLELHQSCKVCSLQFGSEEELRDHLKTSERHAFTFCLECEYDCKDEADVREHQETHQPEEPFRLRDPVSEETRNYVRPPGLPCFACGDKNSFWLASYLIEHLESGQCPSRWTPQAVNYLAVHYTESYHYFRLSYAPLLFGTKRRKPPQPQDKRGGPWACTYCKAVSWDWATSFKHILSTECAEYPLPLFKCPRCADRFTKLSGLVGHCESPCTGDSYSPDRDRIINDMLVFLKQELAYPDHMILHLDFSMIEHLIEMVTVEH